MSESTFWGETAFLGGWTSAGVIPAGGVMSVKSVWGEITGCSQSNELLATVTNTRSVILICVRLDGCILEIFALLSLSGDLPCVLCRFTVIHKSSLMARVGNFRKWKYGTVVILYRKISGILNLYMGWFWCWYFTGHFVFQEWGPRLRIGLR